MFRRRREQKTDYNLRLALLKSRMPRLVIRRSANGIKCQIIEYHAQGDKTLVEVTSKHLRRFGWRGHGANLPTAYLTGMLAGYAALKKGIKEAIVDIGLQRSTKGNALYACAAGALEAGMAIPLNTDIIPSRERISGKHIAAFASLLKKTPERYKKQFSAYAKSGLEPEKLEEHFVAAQNKIREEFKDMIKLADFEKTAASFLS